MNVPRSQSQNSLEFSRLDGEIYLARRMLEQRLDTDLFEGLTDHNARRERARLAITALGCDTTIIGRRPDRKPETYAAFFERLYGEPLTLKRKARR